MPTNRHQVMASDYLQLSEAERSRTLIVTGKNESRREINSLIREGLGLKGQGREFDMLTRVDLTQAQRRYAPSYEVGMVIQPERNYQREGLIRGEIYRVVEALPGNRLMLLDSNGQTLEINPRRVTQISVYQLERNELSVGDQIRINRNNPSLDLTNGDRMQVVGIAGGVVTLQAIDSGRKVELLAKNALHLEHAYAGTVHSSQGLTADRTLICMETRSRTTSLNLYYVAISRSRQESKIYTDSRVNLPAAVNKKFVKTDAISVVNPSKMNREMINKAELGMEINR